jgi:transposase-like protein
MQRRTWDAKTKALIVLEGLKGKVVAEICTAYHIGQSLYYQWRDRFLPHAATVFEVQQSTQTEAPLERENARLKQLVGEFTLELQKSDELLG